jgi:D-alanyl-D-alanine carboxypeptidase
MNKFHAMKSFYTRKKLQYLKIAIIVVLALIIITIVLINSKSKMNGNDTIAAASDDKAAANTLTPAIGDDQEPNEADEASEVEADEPSNWFTGLDVCRPTLTSDTISLEKADMSLFTSNADTAWDQVTLYPEAIPGTLNYTEGIGELSKTDQLSSTYMVLVNVDTGEIVAERDCEEVINPASMTKIMTVLTAMDYITEDNLTDTFVMTQEILETVYQRDMSAVGFRVGDEVTVKDLLYGTIVCSGGDAAMALAEYCCGSEEAFVEKMNENAELLGLSSGTHFTNVVGVYDEDHHATVNDIASILSVAIQNDLLLDVLSTRKYETDTQFVYNSNSEIVDIAPSEADDSYTIKGIEISNWFLRKIEDKEVDGTVVAAKTGYVSQSGFCAASYYEANSGARYICVTGNAFSSWRAIYDHVSVYRSFAK